MSEKISVIVPSYNGSRYLPTCFAALQAQTYANLEVILVDDGSTDDSVCLTQQKFPWVQIIELKQNSGFIRAINQGIRCAKGEIVISLNNDTKVDPGWAGALISAFEKYPEAGLAASKIRLFDQPDFLHSAGDGYGQDGIPINRGVWQVDEGQFDQDTYIFGACGGAVAFRRTMLDEIGLFDEDLFMYCEDVDLNWRAQVAGYRCVFVPEAIVYHHLSATGGGTLASYYTGRNTLLVLAKSAPAVIWRKHFLKIAKAQFKIALEAGRAWRGEAARARLQGQLAGLIALPRWLMKRRCIQNKQRVSDTYLTSLLTE